MRVVVQRVKEASVSIESKIVNEISKGLLVYLGIHEDDRIEDVIKMANKVANLRIFEDENNKMNLNIKKVEGQFLIISQFTLYGDTTRGNRPSFISAAKPEVAIPLYDAFIKHLEKSFVVKSGEFGANMQISSINDGPVTIII